MDKATIITLVLGGSFAALFLGAPVGPLLAFGAMAGLFLLTGSFEAATSLLLAAGFDVSSSFGYIVIPMFIMMGAVAAQTGIVNDLFDAAYKLVGRVAGGLAVATCCASAAFGAVTGSSISAASAMTKVALPQMQKYGYSTRLSAGIIAVSGTLAMMIPPSLMMVFYGIIAQQSIGKLLISGVLPGLFTVLVYSVIILVRAKLNPSIAPAGPRFPVSEIVRSSVKASPFLLVLAALMGGLLLGVWTPNEASAGGVVVVILIGLAKRSLSFQRLFHAGVDSIVTSAAVLVLVMGSILFGKFLALSGITSGLTTMTENAQLSSFQLFLLLVAVYLVLGTFLEGISILALTVPIVLPIILKAGWDPIWFGVILIKLIEIGAVTPPVGLNIFAVKGAAPELKSSDIIMGAVPFWISEIFILFVLYFAPSIALFLPSLM
ncbi:TRAP transporter large permease [Enterovirga rhinocerotis]|uniref:Tripartite ATP-independent transporter DctM subunit n=1 Tax=Enterovirga rhinocerotis TaxID=1339210 RepID=A0A4R7C3D4_9HYPH|nr:TRAP transporter large permease [Enterovirga rhinocerotis]TDR92944.1 tripartite ATP-independent transporter DctM subunit [Enterovirga rhinocerotis]